MNGMHLLLIDTCLPIYYFSLFLFFFNDTATTEIYTLSLHDALPICRREAAVIRFRISEFGFRICRIRLVRSEEHTSELQSPDHLVCRLLLEKKKKQGPPDDCQHRRVQEPFEPDRHDLLA